MEQFLFLDGEPIEPKLPLRSLFFGEGVFETFRWKGKPPVFLEKHLARMKNGAKYLDIPLPSDAVVKRNLKEAVGKAGVEDAYVKICLLASGPLKFYEKAARGHVLIVVRKYDEPKERLRVHVSSLVRSSSSPLLRLKSVNYLENVIARRAAADIKYDEAIFLNERGEVTEGSSTNIFLVKNQTLFTPALECGLLPGITREVLMSIGSEVGLRVKEGMFGLNELKKSKGAFLTNSLIGISAITNIDGDEISLDEDLFKRLRESLFKKLGWV